MKAPSDADRLIAEQVLQHSFEDGRMLGFRDLAVIAMKAREAAMTEGRPIVTAVQIDAVENAFKAGWNTCFRDKPIGHFSERDAAWQAYRDRYKELTE